MSFARLGVTPVINRRSPSRLPLAVGAQPPYEYQSHQHALGDWLRPIHLNPARPSRSVYPTGLAAQQASKCARFFGHVNRIFIFLCCFFLLLFSPPPFQTHTQLHKARAISSLVLIFQFPVITEAFKLSQRGLAGGFILDLLPEDTSPVNLQHTCVTVKISLAQHGGINVLYRSEVLKLK